MGILFAILIQTPVVPLPQRQPVANHVIEKYALSGKEIEVPEYFEEENKNTYF